MIHTSVTKQLLINQIDLPYDMKCIIKDYVFLDKVSYNNKCKKSIINTEIQNAIVSSLRNVYYPATEPEPLAAIGDGGAVEELIIPDFVAPDNIWAFCANENDTHFLATFCLDCGNYMLDINNDYMYLPISLKRSLCLC